MIWLLQKLIFGHVHKWKTIEQADIYKEGAKDGERRLGMVFIQKCEACGTVIRRDLT